MFGHNEIVGQKYFEKMETDSLLVTSRFLTIQGEGPFAGRTALFLRLAKCNLNCAFCDTYFDSGEKLSFLKIFSELQDAVGANPFPKLLVLTGGEPLLQKNIVPFIDRAFDLFPYIQIESNGIVPQDIPAGTTLVISPKCSEKTHKYLKPHPKNLERADCLKFVMSSDTSSPYHYVPQWAHDWHIETGKDIFVSPMNIYNQEPQKAKDLRMKKNNITIKDRSEVDEVISFWDPGLLDMAANQANHEYTARYAIETGCRLNLQLHLYCSLA